MKIASLDIIEIEEMEMTDGSLYRRLCENNWEQLIGQSWEVVSPYFEIELEERYKNFLRDRKTYG